MMASSLGCGRVCAPKQFIQVPRRALLHTAPERGELLIVAGKGKTRYRQSGNAGGLPTRPPTPPVDPENEEFVVFVRATKLPRWIPFSIVKGGVQANLLVKAMKGNFGKEFYSKTLINQIGQSIYKEKENIVMSVRKAIPGYSNFEEFEFGFKIRNKEKAEDWMSPDGVVLLPREEELPKGMLDSMKQSFSAAFGGDNK